MATSTCRKYSIWRQNERFDINTVTLTHFLIHLSIHLSQYLLLVEQIGQCCRDLFA